jgi:signal transduction histidine kinase
MFINLEVTLTEMEKKSALFRINTLFIALIILFLFSVPVNSAESTSSLKTVRAGFFSNGDFMHKTSDGAYEGYDIEYYHKIAGYAGWNIQFVDYDNLNDALKGLEDGEIDILSGLSLTSERTAKYLVSNEKMATARIAVQSREDDDRFSAGDPETMADMSCGILKGSNVIALYTNWCTANGLTPKIIEYDTLDERNEALLSGKVDAIAGGSTIEGAQKIAQFPSLDLYFMFNTSCTEIKKSLDRAMGILSLEDPTFVDNLFAKYFPVSRNTAPSFSSSEKSYIASHQSIRIAMLADDAPFSLTNSDGTVQGILPDYFSHLSQVIGVDFTYISCADKQAICEALASGRADVIGKFGNDIYDADSRSIMLSVPYLKMNLVEITRAGTGDVYKAAVPQCNEDAVRSALTKQKSNITLTSYSCSEECFQKLKSGEVDAVFSTQPAATWLLNQSRSSEYLVLAFGSTTWDASLGFDKESGTILHSIFNKAINADQGYINQLITSETLADSENIATLFNRLPVTYIAASAFILAILLILIIIAFIIILKRRKTELQLEKKKADLMAEEKTNQAKYAFFGAVSHDMRTPLNGITGLTDLALASDITDNMRNYLEKIKKSAAVLTGLVNDTLIMSRLETGKYKYQNSQVMFSEIVDEAIAPVRIKAEEKGVDLSVNMNDLENRSVITDKISLQKVLLGLLSYAVEMSPGGEKVELECCVENGRDELPDTVMKITASGVQVSQELLTHIFEPFAQETFEQSGVSKSGLDLSIAENIINGMGGQISAENCDKGGISFIIKLKLQISDNSYSEDVKSKDMSDAKLKGKTILVCEDNEINMQILCEILERCGAETLRAENGRIGVEAFTDSIPGKIDAILLDIRMPVLDGISAAREIRALNRSDAKSIPIIAVSANTYDEDIEKCKEAGMNDHISKPIDINDLISVILKYQAKDK